MRVLLLVFLVVIYHTTIVLSQIRGQYKWTIRHPGGAKNKLVGFVGEQRTVVVGIKGARDGHIILTPDKDVTKDVFEYVVGGWGNKKTKISRWGSSQEHQAILDQLHPRQYRYFWLDWSDGMFLKGGVGTDPNDASTFIVAQPLHGRRLRFLSLSAFKNTVYYQIVKATNPCFLPIATYNKHRSAACAHRIRGEHLITSYNPDRKLSPTTYKTVGFVGGMTSLLIKVKAPNNGHVILSASTDLTKNLFEYVIGGSTNAGSGFRASIWGEVLAVRNYLSPVLAQNQYRWFWFDWSGGIMRAGEGSVPGDFKTMNSRFTMKVNPAAYPRYLSLSAFENTVKYLIIKDSNQCYLSLDEYNNRVKCGKKKANKKKCLMWDCCWDSKDSFCYKKKQSTYHWLITNPGVTHHPTTYETVGYVGGVKRSGAYQGVTVDIKASQDGYMLASESTAIYRNFFEFVIAGWHDKGVALRTSGGDITIRRDPAVHNIMTSQRYSKFFLAWNQHSFYVGPGDWRNPTNWMSGALSTAGGTRHPKFLSFSGWYNTAKYRFTGDACFLSLHEFYSRVRCGDNVNNEISCPTYCCWDKHYNFCYHK